MKKLVFTVIALLSLNTLAAGGIYCTVDDQNIKFELAGVLSHGIPGGPFNTNGYIQFKNEKLQKFNQQDFSDVVQFWQDGDILNLMVYKEPQTGEFSQLQLKMKTLGCEDCDAYEGAYSFKLRSASNLATFSGRIHCSVE